MIIPTVLRRVLSGFVAYSLLLVPTSSFALTGTNTTMFRGPIQSSSAAPIIERVWYTMDGIGGHSQIIDANGRMVKEGDDYRFIVWIDARLPDGSQTRDDTLQVLASGRLLQDPSSKYYMLQNFVPEYMFPHTQTFTFTAVHNGHATEVSSSATFAVSTKKAVQKEIRTPGKTVKKSKAKPTTLTARQRVKARIEARLAKRTR